MVSVKIDLWTFFTTFGKGRKNCLHWLLVALFMNTD